MNNDEMIENILTLYEKYGVSKDFLSDMTKEDIIRAMKGVLAELDQKKKMPYQEADLVIIKDIYGACC